eukprot:gene6415-7973_t
MCARKFLRRRRTIKKMQQQTLLEQVEREMRQHERALQLQVEVYKKALRQWYVQRKARHDEDLLNEQQTAQQKKLILARRMLKVAQEKERKRREREILEQKLKEEKIELWIRDWEATIARRGDQQRVFCRNALSLPETPEAVQMK